MAGGTGGWGGGDGEPVPDPSDSCVQCSPRFCTSEPGGIPLVGQRCVRSGSNGFKECWTGGQCSNSCGGSGICLTSGGGGGGDTNSFVLEHAAYLFGPIGPDYRAYGVAPYVSDMAVSLAPYIWAKVARAPLAGWATGLTIPTEVHAGFVGLDVNFRVRHVPGTRDFQVWFCGQQEIDTTYSEDEMVFLRVMLNGEEFILGWASRFVTYPYGLGVEIFVAEGRMDGADVSLVIDGSLPGCE
jgi:hypothetical protein